MFHYNITSWVFANLGVGSLHLLIPGQGCEICSKLTIKTLELSK